MTHLPVGAKSPGKCKADMLLSSKHKSVNLIKTKRAVGKILIEFMNRFLFNSGWWPMVAPVKPGEIRDKTLLGVNHNY
jgi:hypothetical protein